MSLNKCCALFWLLMPASFLQLGSAQYGYGYGYPSSYGNSLGSSGMESAVPRVQYSSTMALENPFGMTGGLGSGITGGLGSGMTGGLGNGMTGGLGNGMTGGLGSASYGRRSVADSGRYTAEWVMAPRSKRVVMVPLSAGPNPVVVPLSSSSGVSAVQPPDDMSNAYIIPVFSNDREVEAIQPVKGEYEVLEEVVQLGTDYPRQSSLSPVDPLGVIPAG